MSIEAPGIASSQVAGATVETFNGYDAGISSGFQPTGIGSLTSAATVVEGAGLFGSPTGKGNHLLTSSGSTSIAFAAPVGYFGVWLSAAGTGNRLHVDTVGGHAFNIPLDTLLISAKQSEDTRGNPFATVTTESPEHPYAFFNLFATDAESRITRITLSGNGLVSDNYSIVTDLTAARGQIIESAQVIPNPEPATITQLAVGAASLLGYGWKRRRRVAA